MMSEISLDEASKRVTHAMVHLEQVQALLARQSYLVEQAQELSHRSKAGKHNATILEALQVDIQQRAERAGFDRGLVAVLEPVRSNLEGVQHSLQHWGEDEAAKLVQQVLGAVEEIIAQHSADTTADEDAARALFEDLNKLLVKIHRADQRIHLLSPLPAQPSPAQWEEPGLGGLRVPGALVVLWLGYIASGPNADVSRLVRREIAGLGGFRLRPYKRPASLQPGRDRVFSQILVGDQRNRSAYDPVGGRLKTTPGPRLPEPDRFRDMQLVLDRAPWRPHPGPGRSPDLHAQAIGYFFVPFPTPGSLVGQRLGTAVPRAPDGEDLSKDELLRTLVRLSWGLCADSPHRRESDRSRFEALRAMVFRLVALQAVVTRDVVPPPDEEPGEVRLAIEDHTGLSIMLPMVLEDEVSENTVVIDPELLPKHGRMRGWFSSSWRLPPLHRQRRFGELDHTDDQPKHLWLLSTPVFTGLPSWDEHAVGDPAAGIRDRRRSARVRLLPPARCTLAVPGEDASVIEGEAFLIEFGPGGCTVELPCTDPAHTQGFLEALQDRGELELKLTVHSTLGAPWPARPSDRTEGARIVRARLLPDHQGLSVAKEPRGLRTGDIPALNLRLLLLGAVHEGGEE